MASSIARILSKLRIPIPVALGGTGGTTADEAKSLLGVPGKNRIINGDCRIAQRPSFVVTNTNGYGGPDRFYCANSAGGQFTQSQGTLVYDGVTKYTVKQTVNSVPTDLGSNKLWTGIVQFIEGYNAYDLLGQTITISFLFKASSAGIYSVAIREQTSSYLTTFTAVANVVQKVVITLPVPSSLTIPNNNTNGLQVWVGGQNNASLVAPANGVWAATSYILAPGSKFWSFDVGATIELTDMQLEIGTKATPFERRSIGQELALCQRYYETGGFFHVGYGLAGNNLGSTVKYAVAKRIAPTVISQTNGGGVNNVGTANNVATVTPTEGFLSYRVITATGSAQYQELWTSQAEL